MTIQAASRDGLPRWVRTGFWTVVALEWVVTLALAAALLFAVIHVVMLFTCVPDRTVYASGYSQSGWDAVNVGDRQETVVAVLGEPLRRSVRGAEEWWTYSAERPGADNYRERELRFGSGRLIVAKHEACYID